MHVAIIGCGQLARLLAIAGKTIGIQTSFIALDNESTQCVKDLGRIVHWHRPMNVEGLLLALGNPDVVTVERENVDIKLMLEISMHTRVYPSPESVSICKNRLKEKLALAKLNIASTPWLSVNNPDSVCKAIDTFGLPVVIKSVEDGYDGKNQWQIQSQLELDDLLRQSEKTNWIVEPKVDFIKEVSLIGVRASNGECKFYPLTENQHERGILRKSIAPDQSIEPKLLKRIEKDLQKLFDQWQYVGVMAMELLIVRDGYYVNELAPRVHNSGHWTANQSITSQFENHLRAIFGMPLGRTDFSGFAGMVNILGHANQQDVMTTNQFLEFDNVGTFERRKLTAGEVFMYNKTPKLDRKLGHVNLLDSSRRRLLKKMNQAEQDIYGPSLMASRKSPTLNIRP